MLANLKLRDEYDGLLFLAESARHVQMRHSHHHAELELNLIVKGSLSYVMNGERFTFLSGTLLWFFPQQEHQVVTQSPDALYYVAAFKRSLITKSCRTTLYEGLKSESYNEAGILHTVLKPETAHLIIHLMDALMEGSLDSDLLNREAGFGQASDFVFEHRDPDVLNAGLHLLLLLCWRNRLAGGGSAVPVSLHPVVLRALKLLNEDGREWSLGELAKASGASKSSLSRIFHRQIGVPLSRYRNSLRLSEFLEQYRSSEEKTITEAAYAAGFGSYAQFYKVFLEAYKCGPRETLTQNPSGGNGKMVNVPAV